MDSAKQEKELWDRLANEPERAYRAFESFLRLPSGERTILAAYRSYVGNLPADDCVDISQFRIPAYITWEKVIEGYDIGSDPMDIFRLIGKLIVPLVEEGSLASVGFLDKGIPKCRNVLWGPHTVLRP